MNKDLIFKDTWLAEDVENAKKLEGPIFVIGASGFIGSRLFYSLSKLRDDVYACSIDATKSWRLSLAKQPSLIDLDILNTEGLKDLFQQYQPKTVFNLSAYGAYSRQSDPTKIHVTNYLGSLNLILAMKEYEPSAYVQAGSSSEYGLNCENSNEKSELMPNSDYSVSKIGSAYLLRYYGMVHGFPGAHLRLFSIYGPWEEPDRLIPALVRNGFEKKYPPFTQKDISRDYVFVDDCTRAFVSAALTVCKNNPGEIINVATGKRTTMEGVALSTKKLFHISEKPVFGSMENRKWDLSNWYGDPRMAEKLMKWKYRTDFEDGLKFTAEWQKNAASILPKPGTMPTSRKKITGIFACYKDNQSIPILYERMVKVFKKLNYDYEIIFINDNSPYNDEEVIKNISLKDSNVIGVTHSRNFGTQSGFLSGMGVATGDAVVIMDGDGQDPPELIPEFIKKWEEGYDIVYGERVNREAPLYMRMFYKLFYRVFKSLSDVKIPLDAGDFSLIDRRAVNQLIKLPEKDVFLRGLRAWIGFKQTGVPYVRPERLFGKSTNNFRKNIWWAKKGIFSFSTKPLQYIQTLGLSFFLITIVLGLFYFIDYFINPPHDARGITTVVLIVLGLGSVQLLSISIIGEYVGKIIEEVKNRPRFIRRRMIRNGRIIEEGDTV